MTARDVAGNDIGLLLGEFINVRYTLSLIISPCIHIHLNLYLDWEYSTTFKSG